MNREEYLNRKKYRFYEYFENLAETYPKHREKTSYYWNDIINYCNFFIHEDDSVLEIGCGTGETLSKLKGKNKTGIDYSPKMIAKARERYPELNFILQDATQLELDEKFDIIVVTNVIGFIDNLNELFESLRKVSHPRTKIIISYYNYFWEPIIKFAEWIGLKKRIPNQSWISKQDLANILYLTEFEPYRYTRSMIIPYKIPILSDIINRFIARLPLINSLCINQFMIARPSPYFPKDVVKDKYSVSVVIPARNEEGNIENAIKRIPKMGKHTEVIFVEGNSTDNTWQEIRRVYEKYKTTHDIKITQQQGKGKGDAVRKGFSLATGDILMILDADLTVPPEDLPKFYYAIASLKGEFINGSRLVYPMEKNAMRFLNIIGNKFFSMMFTWLLEQPIKDTLCGTKVIFRKDYERLAGNRHFFGDFDPFGDFDLLFGSYKLNLKIIDLPIRYQERVYGDTNISRFKHGWLLLKMCVFAARKIKFR
ncbi:MAG: glycosyl transferase [Bacteroidia bacterium]|nr:MAG: glycosyl transferase [Bacteroidia bacterium]